MEYMDLIIRIWLTVSIIFLIYKILETNRNTKLILKKLENKLECEDALK